MLRLRPTSVTISQSDLSFHLGQLDIYQGLLKQGFKKQDIIRYFKEQDTANVAARQDNLGPLQSDRPASTVELTWPTQDTSKGLDSCEEDTAAKEEALHQIRNASNVTVHSTHQLEPASPVNDVDSPASKFEHDSGSTVAIRKGGRAHMPRQSSLLRFAHRPNSSSPDSDNLHLNMHSLSPRSNIRYRQRSQTYSYDLSEADEQDVRSEGEAGLLAEIQLLALDNEPARGLGQFVTSSASSLRPQAEEFTPSCLSATVNASTKTVSSQNSAKPPSFPSSPPSPPVGLQTPMHVSTSQMSIPRTEPPRVHRQLDCSFTVYDDTLPPEVQPRTPDDVDHYCHFNPAYTAPPGSLSLHRVICSPEAGARTFSGDQSPTARAMLIRGRRQREFDRGARIERLRIARMRQYDGSDAAQSNDGRAHLHPNVDHEDLWRDELDADRVGEENFDDGDTWPSQLRTTDIPPITDNRRTRS